jgi:hypothetical protein
MTFTRPPEVRGLVLYALAALICPVALAACQIAQAANAQANPPPACATLIAKAVTSSSIAYAGAAACTNFPGQSISDQDFEVFAAMRPVFTRVEAACGYNVSRHAYLFVLGNAGDKSQGVLTVTVRADGKATKIAKHAQLGKVSCTPG